MSGGIVVGTSSWADPGFVAEWYPPKLPAAEQLPSAPRASPSKADTVRVMFNNNRGDDAPVAAQRLGELLGQEVAAR